MNNPANNITLLSLVEKLRVCPSQDNSISEKLLIETWGCFRQLTPEQGDDITPALMAGLVLYDDTRFAPLLNEAEHAQLAALARTALERYQQRTNPPNKLGKIIAATLKEST